MMKGGFANAAVKGLPAIIIVLVLLAFYVSGIWKTSTGLMDVPAFQKAADVPPVSNEALAAAVEQVAAVQKPAECPQTFNALNYLTPNQKGRLQVLGDAIGSKVETCQPELVSYLIRTINAFENDRPQLSFDQLLWIAVTVSTSAASMINSVSCFEGESSCIHGFLVWGMGRDSHVWMNANCLPESVTAGHKIQARTVFLENYESWFNQIKKRFPTIEGYLVTYNESVAEADKFFANPYLMGVPAAMTDTCFNVVLVDGPQGFAKWHPGRMEAAYWSLHMARRCLMEKKVDTVHLFLHDVGRPVEKKIVQRFLFPNSQFLGFVGGKFGELAGFRLTRHTLKPDETS